MGVRHSGWSSVNWSCRGHGRWEYLRLGLKVILKDVHNGLVVRLGLIVLSPAGRVGFWWWSQVK